MAIEWSIDIPNRRVIVDDPSATDGFTIPIQEINDAVRNFEDQPEVMALDNWPADSIIDGIITTTGKDNLGSGVLSPIILTFVNNWRLYHAPHAGPDWVQVSVVGGTVIATNAYGNVATEPSDFTNWVLPVAQAGAILNIDDLLRLRQWMTNRQELAEGDTDNFVLYDDDGVTVKEIQGVADKDGNPIVLPEGAPAKRSTSVVQP